MTEKNFHIIAAWSSIISMPLALGSILLSATILNFDFTLFAEAMGNNAAITLPLLAEVPSFFWWPGLLDFFGFYLLLLPLLVYLHRLFHTESPDWINLFSVCGLGYILMGAMGAATLITVLSSQATAYTMATPATPEIHIAVFEAFATAIQRGVWGILDPILAGIWWTGLGLLLRKYRSYLGWYTFLLGLINLAGGLSAAFRFDAFASICLNIYFLMAPIWAAWMGITILRQNKTHGAWPTSY